MITSLMKTISKSWQAQVALLFFCILSAWWITIYMRGLTFGTENDTFTLIYPLSSLWASIWGFNIAQKWGGLKSYFGRSLVLLTTGIFFQFLGQATYALYIYILGVEVPYPSLGDIGYFGSVIFYALGVLQLHQVIGARLSKQGLRNKFVAIVIPLLLLGFSYTMFLRGYEFDWSTPITVFLDFGYPLGQAIYVALAISVFFLSRRSLGGIMKGPMLFLILALVVQYFSDSMFLFQAYRGSWYA